MKATVNDVRNEPLDRGDLLAAIEPLLGMIGVDAAHVMELHVTGSTLRVRVVPLNKRGKRVPNAVVTVTHRIVT